MSSGDNERVEEALATAPSGQQGRRRIRAACPFCEDERGKRDTKFALSVEAASGLWYCWRCHTGGKLLEPPDPSAVGGTDAPLPEPEPIELPEDFRPLGVEPYASAWETSRARAYLTKRGVTVELVAAVGIGVSLDGRERGRVIIPVHEGGELRWWVGRDFTGSAQRPYLYPVGQRVGCLFNGDALSVETDEPAVIVEGCLDAIACWPHGVAVLGKPTSDQEARMAQARRPIAVALDGDAWAEGWALAARLRLSGARAGAVRLPPGLDPDEVSREWLDAEARRVVVAPL